VTASVFWLNLNSKAEPADKPWKLREFMAVDLDANLIRVFYDFRNDM